MTQAKNKDGVAAPGQAAGDSRAGQDTDQAHVPEAAENFEHTLRRLVIEKQKARKGNFGLYR